MATNFTFNSNFYSSGNTAIDWTLATTGDHTGLVNDPSQFSFVTGVQTVATGQPDIFNVFLAKGQTINLDVDASTIDTAISVVDMYGRLVGFNDDVNAFDPGSTSVLDPKLSFTALQTGFYSIAIHYYEEPYLNGTYSHGTPTVAGTGNYRLVISTPSLAGLQSLGSGSSVLAFGSPADRIDAGEGNDHITLGGGNDIATGGPGNDTLLGGSGDDYLRDDLGNDLLRGEAGNDVLQNSVFSSSSTLEGGAGNDTLIASNISNSALLDGGDGDDLVYISSVGGTLIGGVGIDTLSVSALNPVFFDLAAGTVQIPLSGSSASATGFENVIGGRGNDQISGNSLANRLDGNGGNDVLYGLNGNDTFMGGLGADYMDGGAHTDTVDYSLNPDALVINLATNVHSGLFAQGDTLLNIENVIGSQQFYNTLTGNTLNNQLTGGISNDTLDGGAGHDTLIGGNGNDLFIGGLGNDVYNGGIGVDTVDFSSATSAISVNLTLTTPQNTGQGFDTFLAIENVIGSNYADTIISISAVNDFTGGLGNDTLRGGSGNDTLNGEGDDDLVVGDGGNDRMIGGIGADRLDGGTGNDTLFGDAGADVLVGGRGADVMNGGAGGDRLYADNSADIFVFSDADGALDRVYGFISGLHKVVITGAAFGVTPGAFAFMANANPFAIAPVPTILVDTDTATVWFDANGSTVGGMTQIARFYAPGNVNPATLVASDFVLG
jgi:Ca2+-binding RTX toxin-like protein